MCGMSPAFPISPLLPELLQHLAAHPRLVLEAPPGAGKTTQVPLALLDAPWLAGRKIIMLEPRRVAARSAALFMARQLGEPVGETVGYRIRFENKVSARTRIEVVTEGILTRMLQDDPLLEGVGALLFDEFHERHLSADLGLALALDVQSQLRDDLRIVVMSATLDGERLANFLDAPRLSSEGRSYPVEVSHFPARRDESLEAQTRRAVEQALAEHPGDVLVFLPGQREIAKVQAALSPSPSGGEVGERVGAAASHNSQQHQASRAPSSGAARHLLPQGEGYEVLPLHGELPIEQQSRVLQPDPDGRRRVVLATNVAESSVTLPGVRVVIDAGLAREPRYDPNSGFSRLDAVAISQASADQRAGRAGRVAAGWAWRLWPQSQRLEPQRRPEMAQVELASLALELAAWGSDELRFVDPPPAGALAAARELLQRLGALSKDNTITALGKRMLGLGTHPRMAAMLLSAANAREQALAADLAALLEARDPLRQGGDALAARWRALAAFRSGRAPHDANRSALAAIDAAAKQWRRRLRCDSTPPADIEAHELGDLLAHAFPDRIAVQHPNDPQRYQLANGRSARQFDNSDLRGEPWLVISELRHDPRDALILRAAPVDEARLRSDFPERFRQQDVVRWNSAKRALEARRESSFERIVLDSRPAGQVNPAHAARALTDAVRELGLDALPWTENLQQWRWRVMGLRHWMPELELPDPSDTALLTALDDWLLPAFNGKTRLEALSEDELGEALKSGIDWNTRQLIDRYAPLRINVPSGMDRRIEYALDDEGVLPRPPVLAVKLQELFGLADTPRIADGRVPLLLHLLSPGGKPLQVTGDLKNFWQNTYAEVKKEMKGRYPRHPWPDDPWSATATHRAKPRGT
ncbi:ATP-dependent helicase HrpB [Stenotrophomonas sp. SY1]|uniref:ATP-dependent helicase HrpB n=1 Tax=Stenotrophomonas sp. SY1 TaxID=477235 RepID=UPI001E58BBFF|nr:ATP-dependent helicase HrpB [Stenotrophomonas sp. SY1]MCD9085412.1 ATP-dependent helicase HrpB [Stenotrophomonas sp. SY1]